MKKIFKIIFGFFRHKIIVLLNVEYLNKGRLYLADDIVIRKGTLLSLYKGGNIKIGKGARVSKFVKIAPLGGSVEIGEYCSIGDYCVFLGGTGGIILGSKVMLADSVKIIAFNHNFQDISQPISQQGVNSKGVSIGDGSWLGIGVTILDGVTIGKNCVIGAGSVVTRSIADHSVAAGNPARKIQTIGH